MGKHSQHQQGLQVWVSIQRLLQHLGIALFISPFLQKWYIKTRFDDLQLFCYLGQNINYFFLHISIPPLIPSLVYLPPQFPLWVFLQISPLMGFCNTTLILRLTSFTSSRLLITKSANLAIVLASDFHWYIVRPTKKQNQFCTCSS